MLVELCEMIQVERTGFNNDFDWIFRCDELSSITYNDVEVKDSYLILNIRKGKTDQYRQGNQILISKGMTSACPYAMYNI
ncbi:hypothetical protein KUTeg_015470, partial [Tegillarca granosa]